MPNRNNSKILNAKTILTALVLTILTVTLATAALVHATTFTISLNVTGMRPTSATELQNLGIPATLANLQWNNFISKFVARTQLGYFTGGKTFTLIITNATDTYYYNPSTGKIELGPPVTIEATATANKTGGLTFKIDVSTDVAKLWAYWKIILVMEAWGQKWLVLNYTTAIPAPLATVLYNLTKLSQGAKIPVINSTVYIEKVLKATGTNKILANVTGAVTANLTVKGTNFNVTVTAPNTVTIVNSAGTVVSTYTFETLAVANFTGIKPYKAVALRLPYLQAFVLAIGRMTPQAAELMSEDSCSNYRLTVELVLPSGKEITVYKNLAYNSTWYDIVSGVVHSTKAYCTFGPIYYMTALYEGLTKEKITVSTGVYVYAEVAKVQSTYSDLYYKFLISRKLAIGEVPSVVIMTVVAKPYGLKNYGGIALTTNSTWAYDNRYNGVVGVGLYTYALNTTSNKTLEFVPVLPAPIVEISVNLQKIYSLMNQQLPVYVTSRLGYRWAIVTTAGAKPVVISLQQKATVVGNMTETVYINATYYAKIEGGKATFKPFKGYYLYLYYKSDEVASLNVTLPVKDAIGNKTGTVLINTTIYTAIVPIVIHLKKLELHKVYVNESSTPEVPTPITSKLEVVISRSRSASTGFMTYETCGVVINDSKTYAAPTETYYTYGLTVKPLAIYVTASEPVVEKVVKTNINTATGVINGTATAVERPGTNFGVYYYKIDVYYVGANGAKTEVGVGEFAIGFKYVETTPTLPFYIRTSAGGYIVPIIDVVAGYKIAKSDYMSYVAQFYANGTTLSSMNTTVRSVVIKYVGGTAGEVELVPINAYVAYVGVAVTPTIVYFETMSGRLISSELPTGVSAQVKVIELYNGQKYVLGIISARSVGQLDVVLPVEFNKSGMPVVKTSKVAYMFELDYEGYKLYAVNKTTMKPLVLNVTELLPVKTVYITFPLVSEYAKVVPDEAKVGLPGFVVEVYSVYTGKKIWEAITNSSGLAYLGLLPYGQPVKIVIRTIIPSEDKAWFSNSPNTNRTLAEYGNNYAEYAHWLGYKASENVYTLGTRGSYDAGLVVYTAKIVPKTPNATITIVTQVRPLKIYVVYKNGTKYVTLTSIPVYPCAYPSYCPAIYYNVSLVVVGGVYPRASRVATNGRYYNVSDFEVVAMTWMKPVFEAEAAKYKKLADEALSEAEKYELQTPATTWTRWYTDYVVNKTYYDMYELMALYATSKPYAIFTLPVLLGKYMGITRLFLPGQRLHVKVYYLGYEVFNNMIMVPTNNTIALVLPNGTIVNETSMTVYLPNGTAVKVQPGSVVIVATVKPVTFEIKTKDLKATYKNVYLGVVLSDALLRTTYAGVSMTVVTNRMPILMPFNTTMPVEVRTTAIPLTYVTRTYTTSRTTVSITVSTSRSTKHVTGLVTYMLPLMSAAVANSTEPTLTVATYALVNATLANVTPPALEYYVAKAIWPVTGTEYTYEPSAASTATTFRSLYDLLTYEYTVATAAPVPISSTGVTTIATWRNVYLYNASELKLLLNGTELTSIGKVILNITAEYTVSGSTKSTVVLVENITKYAKAAIHRAVVLIVPLRKLLLEKVPRNVTEITLTVKLNVTKIEGTLKVAANVTTGAGLYVKKVTVPVYVDENGTRHETTLVLPYAEHTEWAAYFGSPELILAPAPNGKVTIPLPMWTVGTAAYGARIARIYVIAAGSSKTENWMKAPGVTEGLIEYRGIAPNTLYPRLAVYDYVLLNYIVLKNKAKAVNYTLFEKTLTFVKPVAAVGALTGATTPLMYLDAVKPVDLINVTSMPTTVTLRTIVLTTLNITNNYPYNVVLLQAEVDGEKLSLVPTVVRNGTYATTKIGYMVPPTVFLNASLYYEAKNKLNAWCTALKTEAASEFVKVYDPELKLKLKYWPPEYTFYTADMKPIVVKPIELVMYEEPMYRTVRVTEITYAFANVTEQPVTISLARYGLTGVSVTLYPETEVHYTAEVAIGNKTARLPLERVLDWNGNPLANVTVAVYANATSDLCHPIAISFVGKNGRLIEPLPAGKRVVIFWYDSYIMFLRKYCKPTSDPKAEFAAPSAAPFIIIYDSAVPEDVSKLGNATASSTVRTWVYKMIIKVTTSTGQPLPGAIVIVKDAATGGQIFYASGVTSSEGSMEVKDIRTAFGGVISQVPAGVYEIDVYLPVKENGKTYLIWAASLVRTLQRGSTAPVQVLPVSVGAVKTTIPVMVQLQLPGGKTEPLGNVEIRAAAQVPAIEFENISGVIIPLTSKVVTVTLGPWTSVTDTSGEATVGPIYVPVKGAVTLKLEAIRMNGIPLGYTAVYKITTVNVTTAPLTITVPATVVQVTAYSANKVPLGNKATVTLTCTYEGKVIYETTGLGTVKAVIPVPYAVFAGKAAITCNATATAAGVKAKAKMIELTKTSVGKTVSVSVVVPITGWYVPGIGFITWQQLVTMIVVIFIVIIIIVIGLIEYQNWRRKRLVSILGAPPSR